MKKILAVCFALVVAISLISCDSSKNSTIRAPANADDLNGKNYEVVVTEFQNAGFTNVETITIEDLPLTRTATDGIVEVISINDLDSFTTDDEFSPDAKVLITYHTVKKVSTPISSEHIQDKALSELNQLFVDAGFTDISMNELYDLDPDSVDSEYQNEVSINGSSVFTEGDNFPCDAKISIVCHYPYEKFIVKIHIDFIPNLIFSTYDVDLSIDGTKQNTLEHGEDGDFEFRLKEGEYTCTFSNAESSSVKGETTINVTCDVEASYKISCYKDRVDIDTTFIDYKNTSAENEAKTMCTESNYLGRNYQEVIVALEELGFTNIKAIPEYDIYFGITKAESTASVTINGSDNFKRGDVFAKDSEIIITYHLSYEDDPNNQTSSTTTPNISQTEPPNTAEQPSDAVSYSSNDKATYKNGNTGIYSYKSMGGLYSIYYIIDFDDGYVYYFLDDEEESWCDRVKTVSGDLNSVLIITYHDGDDVWSYGLHFKWKNQPDHLVVQDNDGFEYDYYPTNLEAALAIRDSKTIRDY